MNKDSKQPEDRRPVSLQYSQSSSLLQEKDSDQVLLSADTLRKSVSFQGKVSEAVAVREGGPPGFATLASSPASLASA